MNPPAIYFIESALVIDSLLGPSQHLCQLPAGHQNKVPGELTHTSPEVGRRRYPLLHNRVVHVGVVSVGNSEVTMGLFISPP